jgi:two-component system, cell cycle sensor histidine kinase and response regulator CckA
MLPDCPTDLIAMLSTSGHYRYASPAYATLLGYPPTALSGTSFFDHAHPDDLGVVADHWRDLLLHGAAQATFRYRHARDGWRWIESHDSIVRLDGTSLIIALRRDLSSQAAWAAELLQTYTLAAIGQLASALAHDFANLLIGIGAFADLALEQLPPHSPVRADLAQIQRAVECGESLIRQLLALTCRPTPARQLLNLNDLVCELSTFLCRIIGAGIVLDTALSPTPTWVCADAPQIEQVLINLALNARDAMLEGGLLTLTTDTIVREQPAAQEQTAMPAGEYVLLSVIDSGSGMSAAVQSQLFEPFFTTKERGRGSGLGLASCAQIVRQHGGYLQVRSAPGEGTTVSVYLPGVTQASEAREQPGG